MSRTLVSHAAGRRTGSVAAVMVIAFMAALPGVVRASEPQSTAGLVAAAQSAAAASDAAPAIATPAPGVELPERARDGITVDTPAGGIDMGLPATGHAAQISGARVFDGGGTDNLIVVEPVADGARAMIQITGADAPAEYRFPIVGATRLEQTADGSVNIYDASGEALGVPVATIAPPWAVDAEGDEVATSYVVDGTTLVQTVRFNAGTAFPVTADPTFSGSCGWFTCTIRLNRAATRNARDAAWIIGAAAGACAVVTAGTAAIICGAAVAPGAVVLAVFAGRYYEEGNCLAIKFSHPPVPSVAWPSRVKRGDHNCS